jgi:N-acetylglutamate synthase-like GNAT family acetyltransferase
MISSPNVSPSPSEKKNTFWVRQARAQDQKTIRELVRTANLNPLDLDWKRFIVAVDANDEVIGCGQIKTHRDGSRELASLVVKNAWRQCGVARHIIETLLQQVPGTLYLMCRSGLGPFYIRFDFRAIEEAQMPIYFRRISRIFRWLRKISHGEQSLLVMKRN